MIKGKPFLLRDIKHQLQVDKGGHRLYSVFMNLNFFSLMSLRSRFSGIT